MANYSVTTYTVKKGTVEDVVSALEAKIETIDNTKTIRLFAIYGTADMQYIGVIIYDT